MTMKYTVLEAVQHILSAMDSDEVDSITDTVESYQVALILKGVYYDMSVELGLPEHETLFRLTASGSSALPCLMTMPSNATRLQELKYNIIDTGETYANWKTLKYMNFDDFLVMQNAWRLDDTGIVVSMDISLGGVTFPILCVDDRQPTWYTSMDDGTILFDSYESTLDTTLQASKTMALGVVYPNFDLSDSFTPIMDATQFPYWLNRAKARAFNELKQTINQEANYEARRQKIVIQKRKESIFKETPIMRMPRYGR